MPEYAGMPLTNAQFEAVTSVGSDVLVSAAAGSGKTRVLAARAVFLVADAPQRVDATELLVVTFTRKAAAEMRGRVAAVLDQRIDATTGEQRVRLQRQRVLLGRAQVGTVHSFCQALLRRHFQAARLDPNFVVLEEDAAFLMRRRVMNDVLDRWFVEPRGPFYELLDGYAGGSATVLATILLRLHGLLGSLPAPRQWRERALEQLETDHFLQAIVDGIAGELAPLRGPLATFEDDFVRLDAAGELPKNFAAYVTDFTETVAHLHDIADAGQLGELRRAFDDWKGRSRIPSMKADHPHRALRDAFDAVRQQVTDNDSLTQLMRFSEADWRDSLTRIRPFASLLFELLDDFDEAFSREKRVIRAVDFDDLEAMSLRLLRENPAIVACERERIRHVLVDEAQDLNPLHDELLRAIAPPDAAFYVGDAKQSIYRFRLADVSLFAARESAFEQGRGGKLIRLADNYRSHPATIAAINDVFSKLMQGGTSEIDYAAGHELSAARTFPDAAKGACDLFVLPGDAAPPDDDEATEADEREAIFVARQLRALIGQETVTHGDETVTIRPGHCAVLLRAARHHADIMARVLRRFGIPVRADVTTGFFDALEVRDVLAVLETIENSRQDLPLAAAIRSPMLALENPEDLLAEIRLAAPPDARMQFHEAFAYAADRDDALGERLRREVRDPLTRFGELFGRLPVGDALWSLLTTQTQYLAWCRSLDDGRQREANVLDLLTRARRHDAEEGGGLGSWLRKLATLRSETELGQPDDKNPAEDAVQIMSIHASKGLEFPVVVLPQIGRAFNESDTTGSVLFERDAGLGLRAVDFERQAHWHSAATVVVRDALKRRGRAEEMRVLYVALTRAEQRLIAVGTEKPSASGPKPLDDPMRGNHPLAWLRHAALSSPRIRLHELSDDDSELWRDDSATPEADARLAQIAAWSDLGGRAEDGATAVRRALETPRKLMLPEATSVTGLSRLEQQRLVGLQPEQDLPIAPLPLRPPLFVDSTAAASEVGSAMHILLDRLDYRRADSIEQVAAQADALVRQGYLRDSSRAALDLESIVWMTRSEVGDTVRSARQVRRELPFVRLLPDAHLLGSGHEVDADRPLLRGRLDLALAINDGWTLVDFKTDRRVPDDLETYDTQLGLYADMLSALTGAPVTRRWLVFLSARHVVTL